MKLTFLFLMIGMMHVSASVYSQSTKLTLELRNKRVVEVLDEIEKQSEFRFAYSSELIDVNRKVSVNINDKKIEKTLDVIFEGTGVTYALHDRHIMLYPKEMDTGTEGKGVQQSTITGKVTDEQGLPLPGVTVLIKGTTNGTVTNMDGKYTIPNIPDGATLQFSFVGMLTQEIVVGTQTEINVTMAAGAIDLEEVVAIGYGTQRKMDLTGAVSTVKVNDINKIPVAGLDQALQGQVSGVQVTANHGAPGADVKVRIRGIGTIGNSEPLYVIDGFPTKGSIRNLNLSDVESISVLKDASSAAIYGARAANGVVLITTKKGKTGKTQVNFDAQYGFQQVANTLDLLDAKDWTMMRNEALVNAGQTPVWSDPYNDPSTNWQKELFRTAPIQKYDLSVSNGGEKTRYVLSAGYFDQEGIVKHSNFNRYTIRLNLDSDVTDKLKVGTNMSLARVVEDQVDTEINGVVRAAMFMPPTVPVYNEDGTYAGPGANEGDAQNPLGMAERSNRSFISAEVLGNVFAEYSFLEEFKLKSSLGVNYNSMQSKHFKPTYEEGNAINQISKLDHTFSNSLDLVWENTLSFNKTIKDNHQIGVMVGNTLEDVSSEWIFGSRENFAINDDFFQYLDAGSSNDKARGNLTEWSLASFYGRVNYDLMGKYLFTANVRHDGSSRFGETNRWGTFPSASVGWRISKESFFDVSIIDDLKVRGSWGQLGNQDIGLYPWASNLSQTYAIFGKNPEKYVGYYPGSDFNTDVKWETTTQIDLGLDLSAFKYRLSLIVDYFNKKTTDMLVILPQPVTSGFSSTGFENLGEVENKGWEFMLSWKDNIRDFSYNLSGNISAIKNKVISLGGDNEPITSGLIFDMSTRTEVGSSIREFYGYTTDGIFQNQDEIDAHATQSGAQPGDIRFKDINDDDVIDSDDRSIIGSPYPDFYYGLNINAEYKGFDLSLMFQGQNGNDIYNAATFWHTNSSFNNYNHSKQILNRWTGPGTSNSEPRVITVDVNQNTRGSSRYLEDGSYLRFKELQIGYTLPVSFAENLGLDRARIYFSGYNLFTFTNYTGYDPEVGAPSQNIGYDEVTYPQAKKIVFGINLVF